MKAGRTLTLYPANGATVRFTTSNAIWEGNTTLNLARGSWDSNWILTGNQIVGGAGNPGTLIYNPFRGG